MHPGEGMQLNWNESSGWGLSVFAFGWDARHRNRGKGKRTASRTGIPAACLVTEITRVTWQGSVQELTTVFFTLRRPTRNRLHPCAVHGPPPNRLPTMQAPRHLWSACP